MADIRFFFIASGLFGATGVMLAALSAHAGGENLSTASLFLIVHAPVLLLVGIAGAERTLLRMAGFVLFFGVLLFSGDLALRDTLGYRLFPMAAPTGGTLMIVGWLIVTQSAVTWSREH